MVLRAGSVYPVLFFVSAIVVKVHDGQVLETPFYVIKGVTTNGERVSVGLIVAERARSWTFPVQDWG